MKNKNRNIVIFSALALLISSCTKQESENKVKDMNIKLSWSMITNMLEGESNCRAALPSKTNLAKPLAIPVGPFIIHKFPGK